MRPKPDQFAFELPGTQHAPDVAAYRTALNVWAAETMAEAVERFERLAAAPVRARGERCSEPFICGPDFYYCHREPGHELPHWGAKQ